MQWAGPVHHAGAHREPEHEPIDRAVQQAKYAADVVANEQPYQPSDSLPFAEPNTRPQLGTIRAPERVPI